MQIVIEISDEMYTAYSKLPPMLGDDGIDSIVQAVANGKPLLKGHGRLIDADVLMAYCQNDINKTVNCNDIARFPTVLGRER